MITPSGAIEAFTFVHCPDLLSWSYFTLNYQAPGAQTRIKSWAGPRFESQHRGACVPRRAGCRMRKGVATSRYEASPPENLWKLRCQILHSGDYLLWNFLLFENYGQEVGGTNTLLVPQPKSWGDQHPSPYSTVVAPMSGMCKTYFTPYLQYKTPIKQISK